MTDSWDAMIAGDDDEVTAEIAADKAAYGYHLRDGNVDACIKIEKKYGLFGLSPQQVSEQLAEMAKPAEGGAA